MFPHVSTGQMIVLPRSKNVWAVIDAKSNKRLGQVIVERRFTDQNDFVPRSNEVLVMSTTEMISAIDLPEYGGWGIDPYKLDDKLQLFVKQLRKPISGKIMKNIRFACEHQRDLAFGGLSSDPT
jgi:hypothetical protein